MQWPFKQMSFVGFIQNGIVLNKDGEQSSIDDGDTIMYEGNQLVLTDVVYTNYTLKDVYVAYLYRDLDYPSYLLKTTEVDAEVIEALDRIELLKLFTQEQQRPEWDTPIGQLPDPLFEWNSTDIDGSQVYAAVEKALTNANRVFVRPIIIVPSDTSCMIHVGNIKQFIEEGTVNRLTMKIAEAPESVVAPKTSVVISQWKVVADDAVATIGERNWPRVICHITQGHEFDFANFPSNHLQMMMNVYFGYKPPKVKHPGSKQYQLDQHQKHKDIICHRQFFKDLDQFVASRKKEFLK